MNNAVYFFSKEKFFNTFCFFLCVLFVCSSITLFANEQLGCAVIKHVSPAQIVQNGKKIETMMRMHTAIMAAVVGTTAAVFCVDMYHIIKQLRTRFIIEKYNDDVRYLAEEVVSQSMKDRVIAFCKTMGTGIAIPIFTAVIMQEITQTLLDHFFHDDSIMWFIKTYAPVDKVLTLAATYARQAINEDDERARAYYKKSIIVLCNRVTEYIEKIVAFLVYKVSYVDKRAQVQIRSVARYIVVCSHKWNKKIALLLNKKMVDYQSVHDVLIAYKDELLCEYDQCEFFENTYASTKNSWIRTIIRFCI